MSSFPKGEDEGAAVEVDHHLTLSYIDIDIDIDILDHAVVDLLVVVVLDLMTLSPGAKVQPNRSTFLSPGGFSAACNSMLRDRAPTPPRFIGQRA